MNKRPQYRKGFRNGNIPYQATVLKDVISVGGRVYQIKKQYPDGTICELYKRTWFRNQWIVAKFYAWKVSSSVRRLFSWISKSRDQKVV
jgi:hypothetical protein